MPDLPTPEDIEIMAVRAGMSVTQACKIAKVSPAVFQRWKAGRASPRLENLEKIMRVLSDAIARKQGAE